MASSNASQAPTDGGRVDFRDGWCCPKHPDVLLRVRKQGEWKILKESCRKCDAVFDVQLEAMRRDLGLAPAGPNVIPHAAPEVPPPAVAAAAMPAPPEEVPIAVAVPAVPHQPLVEQVTAKSFTNADGIQGTYTGSVDSDTGKPHGSGKMVYDHGDVYEGGWKDGNFHGDGVYTWGPGPFQGDNYEGEYLEGKRTGHGVYTWKNGNKYEGEWKDHNRHGRGVFTYADGRTEERTYENDERVA